MKSNIIFDGVSKKFSRSFVSDSLRDTLTDPFKRLFIRDGQPAAKDEFWALKNVSFAVNPGEVLGIIGHNGSGKSTILKLLSRILKPTSGVINVSGRIGALIELGAGFNADLTGRENVYLNAAILGMTKDEINSKYDEIVEFAELQEFMDTPVKWYSSGMFARLGFSIATHTDPQILIVDEVLSVGDFGFQRRCLDRMMNFKTTGVTTVFVSHNMQSVSSLCDRTLLLEKGEVVKIGLTDDIITEYLKGFKSPEGKSDRMISLEMGHLADENGAECTSFESGQKAIASVALSFRKAFTNVIVTFSVRARNGMHIFGTDSMRLTGRPVNIAENQEISTSIELTLNLVPGEYEIGTSIFDRTSQKTIYNEIFSSFVIQNNYCCGGIAYLDPKMINQEISDRKI